MLHHLNHTLSYNIKSIYRCENPLDGMNASLAWWWDFFFFPCIAHDAGCGLVFYQAGLSRDPIRFFLYKHKDTQSCPIFKSSLEICSILKLLNLGHKRLQTLGSDWWLFLVPKLWSMLKTARPLNHSKTVMYEEHLGADGVKQQLCGAGTSERPLQGVGADVGSVLQDVLGDLLDVGVIVLRRVWNRFTWELQKALSLLECEVHVCGELGMKQTSEEEGTERSQGWRKTHNTWESFTAGACSQLQLHVWLTFLQLNHPVVVFEIGVAAKSVCEEHLENKQSSRVKMERKAKSAAAWQQRFSEAGEEIRGLQVRTLQDGLAWSPWCLLPDTQTSADFQHSQLPKFGFLTHSTP